MTFYKLLPIFQTQLETIYYNCVTKTHVNPSGDAFMQHKEHKTPPMKTKVEKVKNQKKLNYETKHYLCY